MKKWVSIVGGLALLLLLFAGAGEIHSWFTDQSLQTNRFSVGENKGKIEEVFPDPEISYGKTVTKEVRVTNTGSVPMYVRASLLFSSKEAQEGSSLVMGSARWEKQEDGYYYYRDVVDPGKTTELLLKGIRWEKEEKETDFDLTVYTETIQAAGHTSAREAFAGMMERKEGQEI